MNIEKWEKTGLLDLVPEDRKEIYATLLENQVRHLKNQSEERMSDDEKVLIETYYLNVVKGVLDSLNFEYTVMRSPLDISENKKAIVAATRKLKTKLDMKNDLSQGCLNFDKIVNQIASELNELGEHYAKQSQKIHFFVPLLLMGKLYIDEKDEQKDVVCFATRYGVA